MEEKEIKEIIAYAIDYCQRKGTNISTQEVFDGYIKGTEESEGDRIKKALIHLVTANKELHFGIDNYDGIKWTILQEWLEKQGKKNPADKVEPKFHEFDQCAFKITKFKIGDWVTDGEHKYKIVGICDGHWYNMVSSDETEKKSDTVIRVNHYFHLWTINDAEDGDILVEGDVILMFRGIGNTEWNDVIDYHCCYDCNRKVFIVQKDLGYWGNTENNQLKPATKEQCDCLFQKMKEAGYAFDFKNKELKKIEQKTA